jgi:hypothetical protein
MSAALVDYALGYAAKGWSVFPLRGKEPRTVHGHLDATTDADQIRLWWERWPDANIGAPVPEPLLVIDIDPRNGGSLENLPTLPPTMTAWSGRMDGGRHFYFRRPPGVRLTSTRLPAGVDLKKNGYLVMPPSIHPATGHPYTWQVPVDQPAARLTDDLLELITYRPRTPLRLVQGGKDSSPDGLIRVVAEATEGGNGRTGRNDALFWAACRAAEEGRLDDLRPALRDAALSTGLTEREVDRTLDSAANRGGAA